MHHGYLFFSKMTSIASQISTLRHVQSSAHRLSPDHRAALRDAISTFERLHRLRVKLIASASENNESLFDATATDLMDVLGIDAVPVVKSNEHREYAAVPEG